MFWFCWLLICVSIFMLVLWVLFFLVVVVVMIAVVSVTSSFSAVSLHVSLLVLVLLLLFILNYGTITTWIWLVGVFLKTPFLNLPKHWALHLNHDHHAITVLWYLRYLRVTCVAFSVFRVLPGSFSLFKTSHELCQCAWPELPLVVLVVLELEMSDSKGVLHADASESPFMDLNISIFSNSTQSLGLMQLSHWSNSSSFKSHVSFLFWLSPLSTITEVWFPSSLYQLLCPPRERLPACNCADHISPTTTLSGYPCSFYYLCITCPSY